MGLRDILRRLLQRRKKGELKSPKERVGEEEDEEETEIEELVALDII